jgi:TatD DNase family protein
MRAMAEVRDENLGELCAAVEANTERVFGGSW